MFHSFFFMRVYFRNMAVGNVCQSATPIQSRIQQKRYFSFGTERFFPQLFWSYPMGYLLRGLFHLLGITGHHRSISEKSRSSWRHIHGELDHVRVNDPSKSNGKQGSVNQHEVSTCQSRCRDPGYQIHVRLKGKRRVGIVLYPVEIRLVV